MSLVANFIGQQPVLRVLAAFVRASRPRYLRELSACCGLSPGGVADVLRRLKEAGALEETLRGNQKQFTLRLERDERRVLAEFFSLCEARRLQDRAVSLSRHAVKKLEWMDAAYTFYREVKGKNR